jgi:hypothetical protein
MFSFTGRVGVFEHFKCVSSTQSLHLVFLISEMFVLYWLAATGPYMLLGQYHDIKRICTCVAGTKLMNKNTR